MHRAILLAVVGSLVACGASEGGTRSAEDAGATRSDAASTGTASTPPAAAPDAGDEAAPPTGGGGSGHGGGTSQGDHSDGPD